MTAVFILNCCGGMEKSYQDNNARDHWRSQFDSSTLFKIPFLCSTE